MVKEWFSLFPPTFILFFFHSRNKNASFLLLGKILFSALEINPRCVVVLHFILNFGLFFFVLQSRVSLKECCTNTNFPAKKLALNKEQTENNQTKCIQQVILKPPEPKNSANKFAQCKPSTNDGECQTGLYLSSIELVILIFL